MYKWEFYQIYFGIETNNFWSENEYIWVFYQIYFGIGTTNFWNWNKYIWEFYQIYLGILSNIEIGANTFGYFIKYILVLELIYFGLNLNRFLLLLRKDYFMKVVIVISWQLKWQWKAFEWRLTFTGSGPWSIDLGKCANFGQSLPALIFPRVCLYEI